VPNDSRMSPWISTTPTTRLYDPADFLGEVHGKHLLAQVKPTLVALTSPLARVQGSQNLVMATGKFGGETVFGGHGAGGHPTAVAVVSDIVAITRVEHGEVRHCRAVWQCRGARFSRERHYLRSREMAPARITTAGSACPAPLRVPLE